MWLEYYFSKLIKKVRCRAISRSKIHASSVVGSGSLIINSSMDRYSYCGYDCQFENVEIGSFCSISDHVFIGCAEHPTSWVSTSPVFQNVNHSGPNKRFAHFDVPPVKRTVVGSDVWIGHGVTIKQGVSIGVGSVIGSNSLVTKDVPPYAVVGGVPAKIIKYRFDEETIGLLLESRWWSLSDKELAEFAELIRTPHDFVMNIKRKDLSASSRRTEV